MPLHRLIYASMLSPTVGLSEIQSILESARKNNQARGVTGILCYDPEYFLQWLEGPRVGVNDIFRRITRDDRHQKLTLLDYREVSARAFENWTMAYITAKEVDSRIFYRYSPKEEFDPFALTADSAARLLETLAELAPKTQH